MTMFDLAALETMERGLAHICAAADPVPGLTRDLSARAEAPDQVRGAAADIAACAMIPAGPAACTFPQGAAA